MSINVATVMDLTEKIYEMSVEDRAFMLRLIGLRQNKFPCMTETQIWRIARSFSEDSGFMSKSGVIEVLETLLKAIKECERNDRTRKVD